MTPEELDLFKKALKHHHDALKEMWTEKVLLRNVIIDSGWMTEPNLDAAIARAKANPTIIRQVEEFWAGSEQKLAELGLDSWLEDFDEQFPNND
jgi:hypothetical protein